VLMFAGWRFASSSENIPGDNVTPDPHHPDFTHLRQLYFQVDPEYKGRFTVPILYDYKQGKIVNNEVPSALVYATAEAALYRED
jgi:glutathionyl-hydroquinone reductase